MSLIPLLLAVVHNFCLVGKAFVTDVILPPVTEPSLILFKALLRASVSVFLLVCKEFVTCVTALSVPRGRFRQTDLVSALRGGVSVDAESDFVGLVIFCQVVR